MKNPLDVLALSGIPLKKRFLARRLIKLLIGTVLFVVVALVMRENLQIEGLWFYLVSGVFGATVLHFLIPKIFGPIVFGRLFCGYACWTAMVLDFLPHRRSPGVILAWTKFRYVHFAISLAVVIVAFTVFNQQPFAQLDTGLIELAGASIKFFSFHPLTQLDTASYVFRWFMIGNALYFAVGIGLAFGLKDNRAFCKYVCPITLFLKTGTRPSLIKIDARRDACDECGRCDRVCPMDIEISQYVKQGSRILSTECILCSTCVDVCPTDALFWSVKRDLGGKEYLREREHTPKGTKTTANE
jgi:polyferredoxin